jgi:N-acetylmuramoyl-L-alanine amidase
MSKVLICLDPGHGGADPGAVSKSGLREADVALTLAEKVSAALGKYEGVAVTFTRDRKTSASYPAPPQGLYKRVEIANASGADFFLSFHCNSGGGKGYESFIAATASAFSKKAQGVLNERILAFLKGYGIGAHGDPAKVDSESARGRIYVLRATKMPAVLLENLFIDNPAEEKLLRDDKFLNGLAAAIAEALAALFGLKKKVEAKPMHHVVVDGKAVIDSAYKDKVLAAISAALDKYQGEIRITK